MGLKIKNFQDTLQSMVDWIIQNSISLVDFSPGSAIRTLLEDISDEIEDFYFKMWQNFNYSMENAIYDSFSFPRKAAVAAYDYETINFINPLSSDLIIPAGTEFATDSNNNNINGGSPLYYQTNVNYTVTAGSTMAQVMVYCTTAGTIGNVAEDSITVMVNQIPGASTVTNENRLVTGIDQESLSERKSRFTQFISSRAKGTVAALKYGALEVPQITGVYVDEGKSGLVNLYCHDAAGNLNTDLKQAVEENEVNYKAAGVPLFVVPIVKDSIDITVTVTVIYQNNTSDYQTYIQQNIQSFFDQFIAGQGYSVSDLNLFIRQLDQVSIKDVVITTPISDFTVLPSQLIRSGNVTVNLVSAGS